MCCAERNTASRGRSDVPLTFLRSRTWRRMRATRVCSIAIVLPSGLPGLAPDHFTLVTNALAPIWLWRSLLADERRLLADDLLVDTDHVQSSGRLHLKRGALKGLQLDGMRVADVEQQVAAAQLGTVAGALDLQRLAESRRH